MPERFDPEGPTNQYHRHENKPQRRHRTIFYRRRSPARRPNLTPKDKELLQLRTYKISTIAFFNASTQLNFLSACCRKNIIPKGLKLRKTCVAVKKSQTNIQDRFKVVLDTAERSLQKELMSHLQAVADAELATSIKATADMEIAINSASTTELISHEIFLSATKANVNRQRDKKHYTACNKLNELLGRQHRNKSRDFYRLIPPVELPDLPHTITSTQSLSANKETNQRSVRTLLPAATAKTAPTEVKTRPLPFSRAPFPVISNHPTSHPENYSPSTPSSSSSPPSPLPSLPNRTCYTPNMASLVAVKESIPSKKTLPPSHPKQNNHQCQAYT